MNELLSKTALLLAGALIGWLLRWKRDKKYFDALKHELELLQEYLKKISFFND